MVVARTGPMAPPRFLSIVFIPKPTAVLSLGTETEIMFTIGIISDTTPTSATATSIVNSNVGASAEDKQQQTDDADGCAQCKYGFWSYSGYKSAH